MASPDCGSIRRDGIDWDLRSLKGRQEVYYVNDKDTGDATNTTYTFDLCSGLGNHREKGEKGCLLGSWGRSPKPKLGY